MQSPKSQPITLSPLLKISNFLQMKSISIQQFWLTPRNYASPQDIITFCSSIGLKISIHDEINMKSEIFNDREIISIYDFCQYIPYWKINGKQMVSDFLKKRSEMLIQQLQAKEKKRPKSSNVVRNKNNHHMTSNLNTMNATASSSTYQLRKGYSLSKMRRQSPSHNNFMNTHNNSSTNCNQLAPSFTQNNSRKYLQKFKQRQQIMQKQLAETIDKTKNQYQYSMLLKMSQMNQNNRQTNNNQTYRAYKSAQGIIRVRIFQLNKFIKQINLKQFDRIYKSFKKNNKQKKQWTVVENQNNIKENNNVHSLKMKNARKSDRQQELKNLLVNTVNLTNLLKEQIKIFKKKGIYGCEDL